MSKPESPMTPPPRHPDPQSIGEHPRGSSWCHAVRRGKHEGDRKSSWASDSAKNARRMLMPINGAQARKRMREIRYQRRPEGLRGINPRFLSSFRGSRFVFLSIVLSDQTGQIHATYPDTVQISHSEQYRRHANR